MVTPLETRAARLRSAGPPSQAANLNRMAGTRAVAPWWSWMGMGMLVLAGCGTIREQRATDQLLLSDAVDRAVAQIDFSPLAYEKVYLDTRYLQFKNESSVTTNYVISALRQQMISAGCMLHDTPEAAEYVVEARIGTLGADGHDLNLGVPASNSMNAAASLVSSVPALPVIPEISIARRTEDKAAAKIAAFAYSRESRMPVWQSGTSVARSEAQGTWILGAGPFQKGAIYDGAQFAGSRIPVRKRSRSSPMVEHEDAYHRPEIWDSELRRKIVEGRHLNPPDAQHEESALEDGVADEDAVEVATNPESPAQ